MSLTKSFDSSQVNERDIQDDRRGSMVEIKINVLNLATSYGCPFGYRGKYKVSL